MALQPSLAISAAEHDYIVKGVALDVRNDGRGRLTTRPFSVDTRATLVRSLAPPPTLTSALSYSLVLSSCVLYFCGNQLANTNGAARVSLGIDLRTDVICGVKLEVRFLAPD
jgi:exosome complex RNA-binding protein Rrp42 (RNase PH superfamily)